MSKFQKCLDEPSYNEYNDAMLENELRDKEKARWKEEDERYLGIQELNNDGEMGWK